MTTYYLAIDIGASSGRHILGWIEHGKLYLEEVHRFKNDIKKMDTHMYWDLDYLFQEIKNGLKICKSIGKTPTYMGIDTWAVDFVMLDKNETIIGLPFSYRDKRTENMDKEVYKIISEENLYKRTGIQKQIFNSIYQLMAIKKNQPDFMNKAKDFLMIPDYFNYLLTGKKSTDYTNATTTQLVDPITKEWDYELIKMLGYNENIFKPLSHPSTILGQFTKELENEIGFNLNIVQVASHDTASSVMAVTNDDGIYISSGTWSLMGVELMQADCSEKSRVHNMTNEGGFEQRFRYLKNIMGLWIIQNVQKECEHGYSFTELCNMAEENKDFASRIDVNDKRFLSPAHMTEEIQLYCQETKQKVPKFIGEVASVVYHSLAESYAESAKEIECLLNKKYEKIYIVGGGCQADYLNRLTAEKTGKEIFAGPIEATAIGNLAAQMIAAKEFKNLTDARQTIKNSFEIIKY